MAVYRDASSSRSFCVLYPGDIVRLAARLSDETISRLGNCLSSHGLTYEQYVALIEGKDVPVMHFMKGNPLT